jgi:hypothetical protein
MMGILWAEAPSAYPREKVIFFFNKWMDIRQFLQHATTASGCGIP